MDNYKINFPQHGRVWVNPTLIVKKREKLQRKKNDKFTVGKYVVTVNPGDDEDFTCQENLIESYLVEEMLGFKEEEEEEEEEKPRSTGESDETTKPNKKINKIN